MGNAFGNFVIRQDEHVLTPLVYIGVARLREKRSIFVPIIYADGTSHETASVERTVSPDPGQRASTYKEPSQKVPMIASFRLPGICSFRIGGNGNSKMIPSSVMLITGTETQKLK
ncbi:MAG: hypothetical protein Q9227_000131 [Pyrenula ochraceoflavens]